MTDMNNKITIISLGHIVPDYYKYIDYLLYSLGEVLSEIINLNIEWIFLYDVREKEFKQEEELKKTIKKYNLINYKIERIHGGSLSALFYILNYVETPYIFYLEHDFVFLKNNFNIAKIVEVFDKYSFVNKILFKKDGNTESLLWAYTDVDNNHIDFLQEEMITEIPLIQACYWSNNPHFIRLSFLEALSKKVYPTEYNNLFKENKIYSGAGGYEEPIIDLYKKEVSTKKWSDVKKFWGTFLYGELNESTYIAHTDASNRYDTECEQLGKDWIINVFNK